MGMFSLGPARSGHQDEIKDARELSGKTPMREMARKLEEAGRLVKS